MNAMRKISGLLRRTMNQPGCTAVIVGGGSGTRMGGIDKLRADLCGQPVLLRTAMAFQACAQVTELVVVARKEQCADWERRLRDAGISKLSSVTPGGASRTDSVVCGLNALQDKTGLVAIQDGARPLVTGELLLRVLAAAARYGAAAPAIPVKDTIKRCTDGATETLDRASLRAVQTPQIFDFDILRGALAKAQSEHWVLTDDCSAVERLGIQVRLVPGEEENLKITTPVDLSLARLLQQRRLQE